MLKWMRIFIPEKIRRKRIKAEWDNKPDEDILEAYVDCVELLEKYQAEGKAKDEIAVSCAKNLELYILPQIEKRSLGAACPLKVK